MRLFHNIRSFSVMATILGVMCLGLVTPALALVIASPTDGQVVRDQVAIVIPRASLSGEVLSSGFLAIKINGEFRAAVGVTEPESDSDGVAPAGPNIVYIWDTKSVGGDLSMRGRERKVTKDGNYEITVEAHALQKQKSGIPAKDTIVETAKVKVQLKNKIDQSNPPAPVDMKYRFKLGEINKYKFNVTGELFDQFGFSMSGGQPPILAEFNVMQSAEDVRWDGTALVRCKLDKEGGFCQTFGDINVLARTAVFRSVYKVLDSSGRIIDPNVFSTRVTNEVTDCLVTLPGAGAMTGAQWPSSFRLKLEGLTEPADLVGQSRFDSLEWEGGLECVKIVTDLNGTVTFKAVPFGSVPVTGESVAYFAYRQHKLIKHVLTIKFDATVDSATIAKLQSPIPETKSASSTPSASSYSTPPPTMYSPSSSGSSTSSQGTVPVKVRLVITQELVRK